MCRVSMSRLLLCRRLADFGHRSNRTPLLPSYNHEDCSTVCLAKTDSPETAGRDCLPKGFVIDWKPASLSVPNAPDDPTALIENTENTSRAPKAPREHLAEVPWGLSVE